MRHQPHEKPPAGRRLVFTPDGQEVGRLHFGSDDSHEPVIYAVTDSGQRLILPLDKLKIVRNRFVLEMRKNELQFLAVDPLSAA